MPITVTCPTCSKQANVPDSALGKTVKCGCGTMFSVQAPQRVDDLQLIISPEPAPRATMEPTMPAPQRIRPIGMAPTAGAKEGIAGKLIDGALELIGVLMKGAAIILVLGIIGGAIYLYQRQQPSSKTAQASPTTTSSVAPGSGSDPSAPTKQQGDIDDLLHKFRRTKASDLVKQDDFLAIIYVVKTKTPAAYQREAFDDLLAAADKVPDALRNIDDRQAVRDVLEFAADKVTVSKGTEDTLMSVSGAYAAISKDCKARGTDIQALARKELLGEHIAAKDAPREEPSKDEKFAKDHPYIVVVNGWLEAQKKGGSGHEYWDPEFKALATKLFAVRSWELQRYEEPRKNKSGNGWNAGVQVRISSSNKGGQQIVQDWKVFLMKHGDTGVWLINSVYQGTLDEP
jgi:hypothetical protein